MIIRFMIILFFVSFASATAGIIGGFEPVWEKEEPEPAIKPGYIIEETLIIEEDQAGRKSEPRWRRSPSQSGANTSSSITKTKGYSGFAISYSPAAYGSDYNQICVDEFGSDWGLADWSDLERFYDDGGNLTKLVSNIGFDKKINAWVTRNNKQSYSQSRDYFASFHGHRKPGGYLAHDNINNYYLSLGSWYNTYYVLCKIR